MLFVQHLGLLDRKSRYANFSLKNMQLLSFLDSIPSRLRARGGPAGGQPRAPDGAVRLAVDLLGRPKGRTAAPTR